MAPVTGEESDSSTLLVNELPSSTQLPSPKISRPMTNAWNATMIGTSSASTR